VRAPSDSQIQPAVSTQVSVTADQVRSQADRAQKWFRYATPLASPQSKGQLAPLVAPGICDCDGAFAKIVGFHRNAPARN